MAAVDALIARHAGLDAVFIEGGDDLGDSTFDPELTDLVIYVVDVAAGEKAARRGSPGITESDLLVINKSDLAPAVGASLMNMERDAISVRQDRPYAFTNLKDGDGVEREGPYALDVTFTPEPGSTGCENSSTSSRPPGLSTRSMEAMASSLCVTLRRPKAIVIRSRLSSGTQIMSRCSLRRKASTSI